MNRFQKKNTFSPGRLILLVSIMLFLLIFLLFYRGVSSISRTASDQQTGNILLTISGKSGLSEGALRDHLRPGQISCKL